VWTAEFEDSLAQDTGAIIYPGMMFNLAKERMETTQLWQIVRKMPKGALLHAHMDAMVDFDFLFKVLLSTEGVHLFCHRSLTTAKDLEVAAVKFRYLKSEKGKESIYCLPAIPMLTNTSEQHINMGPESCLRHTSPPHKGR
jgi:adenosine deaminase CECR1